jgi:2,4-dienoyl-CoA reductase-like NADH-dependent reductase (Old Yellow Enzyme family)
VLIEQIEAYLRRTKTTPTRFGREALGDPNFVFNLLDGREPRKKTVRKVLAFIGSRGGSATGRVDR